MKTKRKFTTRLLSLVLCVCMLVGYIPPIEVSAAETVSKIFTQSERATKVNIVPRYLTENYSFMKKYVRESNTMNINDSFKRYGSSNASGAENTLHTGTMQGSKNDLWWASYKWTPNAEELKLLEDPNFSLHFEGAMTPDWHSHWKVFSTEEHWSNAAIRLTRGLNDNTWTYHVNDYGHQSNGDVINSWMANEKNDGVAQSVSASWNNNIVGYQNDQTKSLFYNAYQRWNHGCGNPKTSGAAFYFVDNAWPTSSAYSDAKSYQTIPSGGVSHTVTVQFDEPVRFADNQAHDDIKLYLDAYWGSQSTIGVPDTEYKDPNGGTLTAKFVEMGLNSSGNTYMKFQYTIPGTVDHMYVTGISDNQPDLRKETNLILYNKDGVDIGVRDIKVSTVLVGLNGNPISNITDQVTYARYDGIAPTLTKIDMSGKDITGTSTVPADWNANSGNNRYVYAGVSDTITFKAYFSESIEVADQANVKAVLSITDADGYPIELGIKSVSGKCITFEDLKVTDAMKSANTRITISDIENLVVTDRAGNPLAGEKVKTPAQDIALDVDKPYMTTIATATDGIYLDGNGVFPDTTDGNYFSFPITFYEANNNGAKNSGISGTDIQFSLNMLDDDAYPYRWYMDTNQAVNKKASWIGSTTGTVNTFSDIADNTQYWLHIELDEKVDYNYTNGGLENNGVYFNAELVFNPISDWAGNQSDALACTLKHQVDTEAPTGTLTAPLTLSTDYTNQVATFHAAFSFADNYSIEKVTYRMLRKFTGENDWTAVETATLESPAVGTGLNREYSDSVTYEYNYSSASDAQRQGQVKFEAVVEDRLGNTHTLTSRVVSFNYVIPVNQSYLSDGGTAVKPVVAPKVSIIAPKFAAGGLYNDNTPRTILLIPDEETANADGSYTSFWIYDPWDYSTKSYEYTTCPITDLIEAVDQYRLTGTSTFYSLPGMFYYAHGTVDLENASGTFTKIDAMYKQEVSDMKNLEDLRDYIGNYYGAMDLYMVTTYALDEFTEVPSSINALMNFSSSMSSIEKYTAFLANGTEYAVNVESIVNAEGKTDAQAKADGEPVLDYDAANNLRPASNLNNVTVSFQLSNVSDASAKLDQKYGFELLDTELGESAILLYYEGANQPALTNADYDALSKTAIWNTAVQKSSDGKYTVVLPSGKCTGNGWYILKLRLYDEHNEQYYWFDLGRFLMDATTLDVSIDSFTRTTDTVDSDSLAENEHRYLYAPFVWSVDEIESAYTEGSDITIGLAPMPDNWYSENVLTFSHTNRDSSDALYASYSAPVTSMSQVRVYNATYDVEAGKTGETGVWRDVDTNSDDEGSSFSYTLALAAADDADPYGMTGEGENAQYKLPMVDGTNILVYEIRATNGTVTTKEIVLYVDGEADEFQLKYSLSTNNGINYSNAKVWALDMNSLDFTPMTNSASFAKGQYYFSHYASHDYSGYSEYSFDDDVDDTFFLIDPNGNVSVQALKIVDAEGNILDIDGTGPYCNGISTYGYVETKPSGQQYGYDYGTHFHFTATLSDHNSWISPDSLTITFDEEYSALLRANFSEGNDSSSGNTTDTSGYAEAEPLTIPIPMAKDEDGNLLMVDTDGDGAYDDYAVWEDYKGAQYGIYRTKVRQVGPDEDDTDHEGVVSIDVWGVFRMDPTTDGQFSTNSRRTITVNCEDAYGNQSSGSSSFYCSNDVDFITGSIDEFADFNLDVPVSDNGTLGIGLNIPYIAIDGYGASDFTLSFTRGQGEIKYYTALPMIVEDNIRKYQNDNGETMNEKLDPYIVTVTDLFGDKYDLEVYTDDFGELGVDVSFSTTALTNQDVTVFATATGDYDAIASITSDKGDVGVIDPVDPSNASISVSENCVVTVTTEDGKSRSVTVSNIDKAVDPVSVIYYNQSRGILDVNSDIAPKEVTAVLYCGTELIYATNGAEEYTFGPGRMAGETYTFEYQDLAGNTGSITATLPVDVPIPDDTVADTDAPNLTFSLYAYSKDKYEMIDRFANAETGSEVTGILNSDQNKDFRTRKMRFVISIEDMSETKVLVTPAGTAAPTDYASAKQGSTNDLITLSVNRKTATLEISDNTTFNVYVIDENNNVRSIRDLTVNCIDLIAPVLDVQYEAGIDPETGYSIVTATFVPADKEEQLETILPITQNVPGKQVTLKDSDGNDVTVIRYYHIFAANGEFTFQYMDDLGNRSSVLAQVQGLSTEAAVVTSADWFGTRRNGVGNCVPEISDLVNNDVSIRMRMSKTISNVELFEYNAQMEDGIGAQLENAPVKVSFTGTNIEVTYTGNVAQQIVVRFTASESGRKGIYLLPAVTCIDKDAPVVTLKETVLAENKRSVKFVFTTDEPAVMSLNASSGYVSEHSWIATSEQTKTLYFTDKAGNQLRYQIKDFAGLDLTELDVSYSASADGSNPTDDPVEDLSLSAGKSFYILLNKKADVTLRGEPVGTVEPNVWTELTLPNAGGIHIIKLTDVNTGEEILELVQALPLDTVAPVIDFESATVLVYDDATAEEMLQAIRAGVTVTDNKDADLDFTVTGYPAAVESGLYSLRYSAQDAAGNEVSVYRYLYIMAHDTPMLWINGEVGLPYGKVFLDSGDEIQLTLENMEGMEDQPIVVKFRKGLFTTGQMKYYAETVENMTFSVEETGHYTIYFRSQDRVEFVTYIYVEG